MDDLTHWLISTQVCAWRGTRNSSTADVLKRAEACGAYLHANAQREQTLYCIDALRDKLEDATQLLAEACLLGPDLEAPGAMDEVREGMELAFLDATQVFWRRPFRLFDGAGGCDAVDASRLGDCIRLRRGRRESPNLAPSSRRWRPARPESPNRRDAPRRTRASAKTSTPPRTVHHHWARRSSARPPN